MRSVGNLTAFPKSRFCHTACIATTNLFVLQGNGMITTSLNMVDEYFHFKAGDCHAPIDKCFWQLFYLGQFNHRRKWRYLG